MSRSLRTLLTIAAVAVATIAAAGVGTFPAWVNITLAGAAAGFAAVGIIPPQLPRDGRSSWGNSERVAVPKMTVDAEGRPQAVRYGEDPQSWAHVPNMFTDAARDPHSQYPPAPGSGEPPRKVEP